MSGVQADEWQQVDNILGRSVARSKSESTLNIDQLQILHCFINITMQDLNTMYIQLYTKHIFTLNYNVGLNCFC